MSDTQRALIVLTSHEEMGNTGKRTGFYWEELATPYWAITDNGLEVDIASIRGGKPPADPSSDDANNRPDDVRRFMEDAKAMSSLESSSPVDAVMPEDYVIVYLPGGHGTMWDLAQSDSLNRLLATMYEQGKIVGAVCHGPSGLTEVTLSDGTYLVNGKNVNGFTNSEEQQAGLADVVPFLLETRLEERGAHFVKNSSDFEPYAIRDGRLVTGQNPASSRMVGRLMLEALQELQSSTVR